MCNHFTDGEFIKFFEQMFTPEKEWAIAPSEHLQSDLNSGFSNITAVLRKNTIYKDSKSVRLLLVYWVYNTELGLTTEYIMYLLYLFLGIT